MKISVQDAGFSYDGSNFVWQHINLDIPEGECFCLLGPNGCGKTTLFNCINGSYGLKQGRVLVNGKDVRDYSIGDLAHVMGIVYQEHSAPFPYTSLEVVRMGRTPHLGLLGTPSRQDTEFAYQVMCELGIEDLAGKATPRYPAANGRWCSSPAPCASSRRSCCSTNLLPIWISRIRPWC